MARAKAPKKKPADTRASLTRARAALDAGNDLDAIAALVEVWRVRRSPAIAELVDLLDGRQPARALDGVIATKVDTTRKRLAAADPHDPRLSAVLLDLLEHPKFLTDEPFWQLVVGKLRACADPRLLGPFPALRSTVFARLSPVRLRDRVVRALDEIARETRAARHPTAEEAALETTIASRLGCAIAKRNVEDKILDEIYDDPTADGPRLVYADLLSERGDPRGELIALQFERLGKGLDESQKARERWLLKKHMKEWLGGLAPAVSNTQSYSHTTFERGFVAIADIYDSAEKQLPLTWNDPRWATVEELKGPFKHVIIEKAPLRGLRRITEGMRVDQLDVFARMPEKFRHVRELEVWHHDELGDRARELLGACDGLPALSALTVMFGNGIPLDGVSWLVSETSVARRVERIVVGSSANTGLDDAQLAYDDLVAALAKVSGSVPVVGIIPPWRAWPRPAPIKFRLGHTGTYVPVG